MGHKLPANLSHKDSSWWKLMRHKVQALPHFGYTNLQIYSTRLPTLLAHRPYRPPHYKSKYIKQLFLYILYVLFFVFAFSPHSVKILTTEPVYEKIGTI